MIKFAFTPNLLPWIRKYATFVNANDMAGMLGCTPGTLDNICKRFEIKLCADSDKHVFVEDPPNAKPRPKIKDDRPRVHPRLNPDLRKGFLTSPMQVTPQRDSIAKLDRKAAELHTTTAVLVSVLVDIIAADNLVDAVLNLKD